MFTCPICGESTESVLECDRCAADLVLCDCGALFSWPPETTCRLNGCPFVDGVDDVKRPEKKR